jgi:hypothetical protein
VKVNDLSESLNHELGDGVPYRFETRQKVIGGSPAVLIHEGYAVEVHPHDDGYLLYFWWNGRNQAHGRTSSVAAVARATASWVRGTGLERLAAEFSFVQFSGLQLAFGQGLAKEFQWRQLLGKQDSVYHEVMDAASRDRVLGGMYPLLGHKFVLLRDEYSDDALASIFVTRPGWFRIYEQAGEDAEFEEDAPVPVEFEGDAQAMVSYLSRKLGLDPPADL